jgi:hypothetical protein
MATPNTKRDEKQSSYALYTTPVEALDAIWPYMEQEVRAAKSILEPCAGMLDIADYLDSQVIDIKIYVNELYPVKGVHYDNTADFLAEDNGIGMHDLVITNPPYNKAMECVLKGFEHAPVQWHFLRVSFLESQKRFQGLFNLGKLSDVYVFSYRIGCPKGINRERKGESSAVFYAWYRFDHYHNGPPKLHWLTK